MSSIFALDDIFVRKEEGIFYRFSPSNTLHQGVKKVRRMALVYDPYLSDIELSQSSCKLDAYSTNVNKVV